MVRKNIGILGLIFLLIAFVGPVKAKESDEDPVAIETESEAYELDTITVTAEKQEEAVQEVSMSITVLESLDIEDRNIESLEELGDYVPGLMIFNNGVSGMNTPSMRGIYAPIEASTVATGLFIDGVPVLTGVGFEDSLLDIERVEVLRGPQGTLYGKNTEAGAISVITRQPDNVLSGKLSFKGGKLLSGETGDLLTDNLALNLSGPLQKDKFYFSIAGQHFHEDGFIENTVTGDTVDDREHWFGKAGLRWTPTEQLDISLITSRLEYDDGDLRMNLGEAGAAMFAMYGLIITPEDRKVASDIEGYNKSTADTQSLKIKYDFGNSLTMTSVTGRRVYNDRALGDYDSSSMTLMHSDKDNKSSKIFQELRLDSSSEKLKWLVGLYYDNDHNETNIVTDSDYPTMASTVERNFKGDAYAAFGQVNYCLTPKANLIGGLRYEVQDQEYEDKIFNAKVADSWNEMSPKIAYEYNFTPSFMTYASVSKGYRSGGFNPMASDPKYLSYDEEKLWSYEIGAKRTFLKNRLTLNACLYYMDISDMQVTEAVSPNESYLTNAAKATSKGIELEMSAKVSRGLTITTGYAYNDNEFDNFQDALGDYKGNRNPYTPEYTFNVGAQYRYYNGLYARVDLIGYGKMYFDKASEYSKDPYEIVNVKIGYETERFEYYLYAKNIFDKEYNSDGYYGGFYTIYSDPGAIGLGLTYRF
jgi:iron complex outermembrane receptor protein